MSLVRNQDSPWSKSCSCSTESRAARAAPLLVGVIDQLPSVGSGQVFAHSPGGFRIPQVRRQPIEPEMMRVGDRILADVLRSLPAVGKMFAL